MVVANFLIELRGTGVVGHTSRHKDIIKVGINITFHMVLRVASRSQFLAGLMAKLSIVPPSTLIRVNPISQGHGPLWPMRLEICALFLQFLGKTHVTS